MTRTEPITTWTCGCGSTIEHWNPGEDECCDRCGREFNAFGQELRPGWRGNPSNWDDEISDLDGYEMQYAGDE